VLPMPVRVSRADARVDAVRGCVALERGPLVYAVEQIDQPDGVVVDDLALDTSAPFDAEHRSDLLEGVTVVRARGRLGRRSPHAWPYVPASDGAASAPGPDVDITAVPYFAWANRGIAPMRVWLPEA
jgi:DUF1680 family protein